MEVLKWSKFDNEKLKRPGITNYFQISKDGGTGGSIFRKMYGQFLIEADGILSFKELSKIGEMYIALSEQWDRLANSMWELGQTGDANILKSMSVHILSLYENEKSLCEKLQLSLS
ncbi:hypothetical protein FHR92_003371 [Fontibacillus solani]|uniref:DUF4872 domain-containing protein n=1 Tax=Fontibacillus solani TaxID=1572857 RepID=A0A7W3SVA0_9BACL|nr:hypothetical protein [Fontibacillus solani]